MLVSWPWASCPLPRVTGTVEVSHLERASPTLPRASSHLHSRPYFSPSGITELSQTLPPSVQILSVPPSHWVSTAAALPHLCLTHNPISSPAIAKKKTPKSLVRVIQAHDKNPIASVSTKQNKGNLGF